MSEDPQANQTNADPETPPDLLAARAGSAKPESFFELPGVRKFMRNRMAVVALGIISVFFLTALLIMVPPGLIKSDSVTESVGLSKEPGFGRSASINERINHADRIVGDIAKALTTSDPQYSLEAFGYAERRLSSTDPQVVEDKLDLVNEAFDALDDAMADSDDAHDELFDLEEEAAKQVPPVAVDAQEAKRLNELIEAAEAVKLVELEALEVQLYELLPVPDSFTYKLRMLLGTDAQGRSIFLRAVYSIKTAVQIGFVTSLIAVVMGGLVGAAAGFFGGIIDHVVVWVYSTISAIPYLIWLIVIAFVVREINTPEDWRFFGGIALGQTLIPVYLAFILTFWIGPCRVVRGEAMKIKHLDYIQSARSIGASPKRILLWHVIPNTAYLLFINMSLLFVGSIKAEVILSFLGLGVQGQPSWGIMIRDAKDEVINGFFWQIGAATAFMFVLVLAFNIVSDALQDAFDPKHVG